VTGRWFSPGIPVSSTNKTDCHNITEILLKVALNTITITHVFKFLVIITFFLYRKYQVTEVLEDPE
jgi:hypothetical protein